VAHQDHLLYHQNHYGPFALHHYLIRNSHSGYQLHM
jgi:hypothetical protein